MPNISVVQVLRKDPLEMKTSYREIISQNSLLLHGFSVEYIVFDQLPSMEVVRFIRDYRGLKYYRKDFTTLKQSFLEALHLANGKKVIFLKSGDILTQENVEQMEKVRPNIFKKDVQKLKDLMRENFKYDDFNLLMKENKTFTDKIKLLFS